MFLCIELKTSELYSHILLTLLFKIRCFRNRYQGQILWSRFMGEWLCLRELVFIWLASYSRGEMCDVEWRLGSCFLLIIRLCFWLEHVCCWLTYLPLWWEWLCNMFLQVQEWETRADKRGGGYCWVKNGEMIEGRVESRFNYFGSALIKVEVFGLVTCEGRDCDQNVYGNKEKDMERRFGRIIIWPKI